jgi:hypothetical protein
MSLNLFATIFFALAILHTFTVRRFQHWAGGFAKGSAGERLFHLLGEVEVVFGLWAGVFLIYLAVAEGMGHGVRYLGSLSFTEPLFVFVVMSVCSTRPILHFARRTIELVSRLLPLRPSVAFYAVTLVIGPLLGSFITEPAAMTVTALILFDRYYKHGLSSRLMYATLGLLFVNVSTGGTLTSFAAPPVLMVASIWNWDSLFMLGHFGWKAALACVLSTGGATWLFYRELAAVPPDGPGKAAYPPAWLTFIHILFLAMIVVNAHAPLVFTATFVFFLVVVGLSRRYQGDLKLREGFMVAFFLAGLVVLGPPQRWWLQPLLGRLDALALYLGAIGLTALTDNAALTYLGAQVPDLTEAARYALVAGAVVGGGLTVIANSPNPAGYGILNPAFGEEGISPLKLLVAALPPTLIAAVCFWI